MSIAVTEDGRALADAVRGWAASTITEDVRRATIDAGVDKLPTFWSQLAGQGFLSVHVAEAHGGGGAGLEELAVVVEELGRAMAPGPAVPTMLAMAILGLVDHEALADLASGDRVAAVGLDSASLTLVDGAVSGTSGWIVGGHTADTFVVPASDGDEVRWVLVDRAAVEVEDDDSHDVTRRMSRFTASGAAVDVLDVDAQRPRDLAAVVLSAEASGVAHWAVTTASDYAKVREQFGRPIGQFQGVKHRCARLFALAEQARALAWDAARAQMDAPRTAEASMAAAVAAAVAPSVAVTATQGAIQTLGGIGFTWEHDAHLTMRRAATLRVALGPASAWQQEVARFAIDGVRRTTTVELPESIEPRRLEIREELAGIAALPSDEQTGALARAGYTAPHYPKPWGHGAGAVEQLVIAEELDRAGLAPHDMIIGSWVVPTIIEAGTDEQVQKLLPPSLDGTITWCQLFSEPGAGSDLASLSTKAEKVEGGWILNGQKVWTSQATQCDVGVILARTSSGEKKHHGITYFVLDMEAEGIDIRPIREITGHALFNEIFLDDVFVPEESLVGEVDNGWRLARTTLANERVALANSSTVGDVGEQLVATAAAMERTAVEEVELGRLLCDAQGSAILQLRTLIRAVTGGQQGPEASVAKLLGSANRQEGWETLLLWGGMDELTGTAREEQGRTSPAYQHLNSRHQTIAGGTTNVLLNIIAERILRLPRDPKP